MIKSTSAQSALPENVGFKKGKSRKSSTKQRGHYSKLGDFFFRVITSTYTKLHKKFQIAYSKSQKLASQPGTCDLFSFSGWSGFDTYLFVEISESSAGPDAGEGGSPDTKATFSVGRLFSQS